MMQTVIPVDSDGRARCTITTTTEDQQSQRLLVFTQDSPSEHKLWGPSVRRRPAPRFRVRDRRRWVCRTTRAGGHAAEAVERYRCAAERGEQRVRRPVRGRSCADRASVARTVQAWNATTARRRRRSPWSRTPSDHGRARRRSGGTRSTVDPPQARRNRAPQTRAALFGDGTATSTMKVTYVNIVALYVPQEDSGEQITAVGAERKPIRSRRSDSARRFRSNRSARGPTISRPPPGVACRREIVRPVWHAANRRNRTILGGAME